MLGQEWHRLKTICVPAEALLDTGNIRITLQDLLWVHFAFPPGETGNAKNREHVQHPLLVMTISWPWRHQVLSPRARDCYLLWKGGPCRCAPAKDPGLGRLAGMVQMGLHANTGLRRGAALTKPGRGKDVTTEAERGWISVPRH